jgi:thiosulfate/3-mercaptopyruvate sulfurtransferase
VFIFTLTIITIAGYNRIYRTPKAAVQPKPKDPAELAADKISEYSNPDAIISVYELNSIINDPNLVILDTRGRSFQVFAESYAAHIPGAIPILHGEYCHPAYFDRLAPLLQVQQLMGTKGIDNKKRIVLYGNDGLQGRVYWMLKLYGSENVVQILDGGIEKWKEAGFQTTSQPPKIATAQFGFNTGKAVLNAYTGLEEIVELVLNQPESTAIVDASSRQEYLGGHILSSVNISMDDIQNSDKTLKNKDELAGIFARKGVTPDKTVVVYDTVGIRSSYLWYVLHDLMGYPNVKNYDGGFSEWTARELAIESGEEKNISIPIK